MKRLILGGLALILTSGALAPRTVEAACTLGTRCDPRQCLRNCLIVGYDNGTCDLCTCNCS